MFTIRPNSCLHSDRIVDRRLRPPSPTRVYTWRIVWSSNDISADDRCVDDTGRATQRMIDGLAWLAWVGSKPPSVQNALYAVSHKTCHSIFVHNFEKCWPIFKISSLLDSAVNFQQYLPPHLKRVTTLPCEIQETNNSNALDVFNTIS